MVQARGTPGPGCGWGRILVWVGVFMAVAASPRAETRAVTNTVLAPSAPIVGVAAAPGASWRWSAGEMTAGDLFSVHLGIGRAPVAAWIGGVQSLWAASGVAGAVAGGVAGGSRATSRFEVMGADIPGRLAATGTSLELTWAPAVAPDSHSGGFDIRLAARYVAFTEGPGGARRAAGNALYLSAWSALRF